VATARKNPGGDALPNLTDLADRYGSDKGSSKHRYTELYQMLFLPYRERAIDFLEMGLLIGGPEHGESADRKTTDLPSVRMWLEYFPKARVHGLDVSDFSWFNDRRFTFHRCDMDLRGNIAAARAEMPAFDIIIDDASHASHHQQFAFLELFPRLKPGGLYVIEDLRWQPKEMERPGITKTAALFRGFSEDRAFRHSDAALEAEFAALAPDISGCFVFQARYNKTRRDQVAVIHKR
jgi:SAM-dependent methyltransferase